MDYELGYIDQLYDTVIQNPEIEREETSEILKELKDECKRIPLLMLHSKLAEEQYSAMIRRHQHSIYLLLNSIVKMMEKSSSSDEKQTSRQTELLENFSEELLKMSHTIRDYFPTYIDNAHPLSMPELTKVAQELALKLNDIKTACPSDEQDMLTNILISSIDPAIFIKSKISYAQAEYLIELFDSLVALNQFSPDHLSERYKNQLIEQGFNTPNFYSYCCVEIIKRRDECRDVSESFKEMLWIKKRLEQLTPYKNKCFLNNLPEIRESLLNFVNAEISHLNTLEKIAGELARSGSMQEDFKVSFSVKELAFFIHLQVECGIIIEDKPKKVHEYVVAHYSTMETSKISQKSFKNAYYSHSREDIAKVTTKLAEMLARVQ